MLKREREPHPGDLTDAEGEVLRPLIPGLAKLGHPPRHEKRAIFNAAFYVVRAGCPWRMLPGEMPPWRIVYHYFMRWRRGGIWIELPDALRDALRQRSGKKALRAAILDAQSVECANHRGRRGFDVGRVLVTPANVSDPAGAAILLPEVVACFGGLRHFWNPHRRFKTHGQTASKTSSSDSL